MNDMISTFAGIDPKVKGQTTWQDVLTEIKNQTHHALVEKGQKILFEQGPEFYRKFKETLPAVTFAGKFSYRKKDKIVSTTGLIIPDLDHLQDVDRFFGLLIQDEKVCFAFRSPSGEGIKCGVRTAGIKSDADHKRFFAAVERYFSEIYGVKIDPACKDINRLTFLSSDPDLWVNENPAMFNVEAWAVKSPIKPDFSQYRMNTDNLVGKQKYAVKVLESSCQKIRESVRGQQHCVRLGMGRLVGGYLHYLNGVNVLDELERAVRDSGAQDIGAAMKTVHDGLEFGKAEPITIDNRPSDNSSNSFVSSSAPAAKPDRRAVISAPSLSPKAIPEGIVKDVVELATRHSEADPAAVLSTFLVRFGAEVGAGPYYMVGDTRHAARLFVAIVGATSKARKGTSAAPVRTIFMGSGVTCTPGPLSSGEGLIFAVRDPIQQWKAGKDGEGAWIITDPGVEDKRLFVNDEEMAAGLRCMKREGNTLSPTLRAMWDRGDYSPITKASRISTTGAHVTITTHITQEELRTTLQEVEGFSGFSNRFLWVFARRQKLIALPVPMPDMEVEKIRRELTRLAEHARTVGRMTMTQAAAAQWVDIYPVLSADGFGLVGSVCNRAEAQVIRLSMIYALLDGSSVIDTDHLTAALAFWEYCEDTARYLFSKEAADPIQARILDGLRAGPMTTTEISVNVFRRNLEAARIQTALDVLLQAGLIISATTQTDGRPRTTYAILLQGNEKDEFNEKRSDDVGDNSFNSFNSSPSEESTPGDNSFNSFNSSPSEENAPDDLEVF